MGYSTDFSGRFDLDHCLTVAHMRYLKRFSKTRRMRRKAVETDLLDDPIRKAVGLPIGPEGCYYVGDRDSSGQSSTTDIIDYNCEPADQPGLWCQWVPSEDGMAIEWDGGEKFYNYVEWLQYLIDHFLILWGYRLNGEVTWHGEDVEDFGKIVVTDNVIKIFKGKITYTYVEATDTNEEDL